MQKIFVTSIVIIFVIAAAAIGLAYKFGIKAAVIAAGDISMSPEVQADPNGYQALFITIFDQNSPAPMPFGAMRQKAGDLPMHFTVTKERLQVMLPDAPLPSTLRVKARLDVDGQGGPDRPGDLVGELTNVSLGQQNLEIVINKKIKEK